MPRESFSEQVDSRFNKEGWEIDVSPGLVGGLNTGLPAELIGDEDSPLMENVSSSDGRIKTDTGYSNIGKDSAGADQTLVGVPKRWHEHITGAGTRTPILITDSTVYKYNAALDYFELLVEGKNPGQKQTTTNAIHNTPDVIITVVDSDDFTAGDLVALDLDSGYQHQTTVASVAYSTAATGTVELTGGASGSVDDITVDGVSVMSGAEAFDTDLGTTATNVAANITAHTSVPDYNAAAVGALITITAVTEGTGPNGFVVVSSTTTITTTDVNMAGGIDPSVTLDVAVPTASASGLILRKAFDLTGNDSTSVMAWMLPSHEWLVVTNDIDPPFRYDGTDVSTIPNLPASGVFAAKTGMVFYNHLVFMNVSEGGTRYPYRVWRATAGNPEDYTTGTSGYIDLFDEDDHINACLTLGPDAIVYRSRSIVSMEYTPANVTLFTFGQKVAGSLTGDFGFGTVSPDGVTHFGDSHVLLSASGALLYDGGFDVQILSLKVDQGHFDFSGEVDRSKLFRSFVRYIDERDELWFCYADESAEYPNKALILDRNQGLWRKRVFSHEITSADIRATEDPLPWTALVGDWTVQTFTWSSANVGGGLPTIILTGLLGDVFDYDYVSTSDAGQAIPWKVHTKDFQTIGFNVRLDRFDIFASGAVGSLAFGFFSRDRGVTNEGPLFIIADGDFKRRTSHIQAVTDIYRLVFSGVGPFELGEFAVRRCNEDRWG